ncbi:MAG TPA: hypothetical protein VIS72_11715 [Anaerolineales bacterium]
MRHLSIPAGLAFLSFLLVLSLGDRPRQNTLQELKPVVSAQDQTCDQNPPDDYIQQISGLVDGDELVLQVSARFGGAVDSITWRGKEFINVFDHGRQISYAWQMDGYGECLNPTEPGSASDLFKPSSTSDLLEVCRPESNLLTTTVQPAYWLAPGETGFCEGTVEAVNDTLISDHIMHKTIEIGYGSIENVIAFTAEITTQEPYTRLHLEAPTGYLTYEFTNYYRYDPSTGELLKPESQPLVEPWSFVHVSKVPPILATEDGAYAMGAYTAEDVIVYEILMYDVPNPEDRTNKWNIIIHEVPAPAGVYTYQSFIIVGTLEQVTDGMRRLFELHPTDFAPPEGYVDLANCEAIDGWAWDPKAPNQPINIEVRRVNEDGAETALYTTSANRYREDLASALGDNGGHGYSIATSDVLKSGERQTIRVYGFNSNLNLPPQALIPSEITLECPQFEPAPTQPNTNEQADDPTGEQTQTDGKPSLPCIGWMFPAMLGIVFRMKKHPQAQDDIIIREL